ncbi:MAG: hypothetical protein QM774_01665 [Gordonia sp. (in: high G+C Gram-positive bacteria)]|uniref:hypothetical protein n=1 Tax=Gordonia sp. (in: high G+C Gram-positive bacteria) TaxID=84139 RepID=UPI0039E4421D
MEPVEVNAGAWYLRGLRADDRLSDVAALTDLGAADPAGYVAGTEDGWRAGDRCVWAVCEPTTGELLAVVGVRAPAGSASRMTGRARSGGTEALAAAVGPVRRFAREALDWDVDDRLDDRWP